MLKLIKLPLVFLLFATGCANPSYFNMQTGYVANNWKTVAVTPFSGDVRFVEVATDTFVTHLIAQNKFKLIQPSVVKVNAQQVYVNIGDSSIGVMEAQRIGELVNADAVIVGVVTSHNTDGMMNGFSTVKLVDVRTGDVVASSHKPSGLLVAHSEHQCVVKAVERSAKDILAALQRIKVNIPSDGTVIGSPHT